MQQCRVPRSAVAVLQEGKQALDEQVQAQDGTVQAEGQVVLFCVDELVACHVSCQDATQHCQGKQAGAHHTQGCRQLHRHPSSLEDATSLSLFSGD